MTTQEQAKERARCIFRNAIAGHEVSCEAYVADAEGVVREFLDHKEKRNIDKLIAIKRLIENAIDEEWYICGLKQARATITLLESLEKEDA